MMSSQVAQHYLRDLGLLLKDLALQAKLDRDASQGGEDEDLKLGRLMAFHEVLSLMQDQAQAFGIELDTIGLQGFDPDTDLL